MSIQFFTDKHFCLLAAKTRIVILGKTGAGKSSLGNTIFGEEQFKVGDDFDSETSVCEAKTRSINGREITLIDMPGFFDTSRPEEEMKPEIVRCITECSPGPHAFLILLKVERITDQEKEIIKKIQQCFSEDVLKFATILFTYGDQISKGKTVMDYVHKNKYASDLVERCGGRCHVIDSRYWKDRPKDEYRSNQYQVEELLKSIEETVKANQGKCYTNEMLKAVEEFIQQEAQRIAKSSGNMSEEEIREKAKGSVHAILIKATAITTGALLGAFFGLTAIADAVVKGIKSAMRSAKEAPAENTEENTAGQPEGELAAATAALVVGALVEGPVAAGAMFGAFKGYHAADGAETLGEAVKKVSEALISSSLQRK